MNALARAMIIGGILWALLSLLSVPCAPLLSVILLVATMAQHEWAGIVGAIAISICAEAILLVPSGIFMTAYLATYMVVRVMVRRFHVDTLAMRTLLCGGGVVCAMVLVHLLYVSREVGWWTTFEWRDVYTVATTTTLAVVLVSIVRGSARARSRAVILSEAKDLQHGKRCIYVSLPTCH